MRHKQFYLIMTILILISIVAWLFAGRRTVSASPGYTDPVIPAAWAALKEGSAFTDQPEIMAAEKRYSPRELGSFFTNDGDYMLSLPVLRECAHTLVFADGGHTIRMFRGSDVISVDLSSDSVTVNGFTEKHAGCVLSIGGEYYVSANCFGRLLGFEWLKWDGGKTAEIRETKLNYLPPKFSYADIGKLPEVQNQGDLGTCWAFAPLSAAESTLLPGEKGVFSRDHMVLCNSYGAMYFGGSRQAALSYLLSWQGPVLDEDDVYGDGQADLSLAAAYHVQNAEIFNDPSVEDIKEAVFLYGGAEASLYLCFADETAYSDAFRYYNEDEAAYCYFGKRPVNHDVLIVGWDDGYPKSNFKNNANIAGNGAFLCLNSWGKSFGKDGLFWVSYYDTSIAATGMCLKGIEPADNYDHIYQTDLCGITADIGYQSDTAWFANAYTAGGDEWLEAAGFYTLGADSAYEIYLVHDFEGPDDFSRRLLLKTGVIDGEGYTTVKFDSRIPLRKHEKFAVVVKLVTPDVFYPIGAEQRTEDAPNVNLKDGEGYISPTGARFKRTEDTLSCNVCLKVYTTDGN